MTRRSTWTGDDHGSITLELAILTPAMILLLGLVALAGRVEVAASAVEHAATSGARAASLARTVDAAQVAASEAVGRELDAQGLRCATSTVTVEATGLAAPLGEPAAVTVTTSCTVTMSDLAVPGLPGSRTLTGQATSAVDRYRGR
ncbi:MAG: pilus assembly protein [Actinomycetales bacterium]|nr:pilus assembly protein [Actinomycetales bacterium]